MEARFSGPMLPFLQEIIAGRSFSMPLAEHLGFHVVEAARGVVTVELTPGEVHQNIAGTVHGGVLSVIADSAMGLAFGTTIEAGQSFTTVEQKINYLRPVFDKTVRARGEVIQRGRTLGFMECRILDSDGKLVAFATSTYAVLDGQSAQGREIRDEYGGQETDG
ncbi:MAG: PaaI family thioesterase [Bryobacterales bacterium]|nr:PaaI family thioesterase [Bryobacterales bacterium]